jgi:formylglycine-generating enzyme required for sulfatase activity
MRALFATVCLVLAASGPAHAGADKLFAVLPLDVTKTQGKLDPAARAALEEMLRDVSANALSSRGWTVMTGETTLQLLRINNINPEACEGSCHLETAQRISADRFISGSVQWSDGEFTASIRLIDTATGRILASQRLEGPTAKALRKAFEAKADDFFVKSGLVPAAAPPPVIPPAAQAAPQQAQQPAPPPQPAPLPWPRPGVTKDEPVTGLTFVWIPGGTFVVGCERGDPDCFDSESPVRTATVGPYWYGKFEVTTEVYTRCVQAGKCAPANTVPDVCNYSRRPAHPINCVNFTEAQKFCAWIGGRLPSPEEFEFASKGGEGRIHPWGNEPLDVTRANFCDKQCLAVSPDAKGWARADLDDGWGGTAPPGSYPRGASKWGQLDLAGNVWEWTTGLSDGKREFRGGGWYDMHRWLRSSAKLSVTPETGAINLGIRCVVP